MMTSVLALLIALAPGDATTPSPPPLPTYVIQGDGTRIDCTSNYEFCWKEES